MTLNYSGQKQQFQIHQNSRAKAWLLVLICLFVSAGLSSCRKHCDQSARIHVRIAGAKSGFALLEIYQDEVILSSVDTLRCTHGPDGCIIDTSIARTITGPRIGRVLTDHRVVMLFLSSGRDVRVMVDHTSEQSVLFTGISGGDSRVLTMLFDGMGHMNDELDYYYSLCGKTTLTEYLDSLTLRQDSCDEALTAISRDLQCTPEFLRYLHRENRLRHILFLGLWFDVNNPTIVEYNTAELKDYSLADLDTILPHNSFYFQPAVSALLRIEENRNRAQTMPGRTPLDMTPDSLLEIASRRIPPKLFASFFIRNLEQLLYSNPSDNLMSATRLMNSYSNRLDSTHRTSAMNVISRFQERIAYQDSVDSHPPADSLDIRNLGLRGDSLDLSTLDGQVVYLDFWASWCAPCLAELPYAQRLKQCLKGEEVAFVYVSLDDDLQRWNAAIKKHGISGYHARLSQEQRKLYAGLLAEGIPRYLIIDQSGTIVNPNAPRPSNPQTCDEIRQIVNRKY